jgi:hypothetical protein
MKKKFLLICSFCIFSFAQCQQNQRSSVIDNLTGNLIYISQYVDVQGSQFLYDNWLTGKIELRNGALFNDLQLKFDNYSNKFIVNKRDTAYEIISDIHKVWIYPEMPDTLLFENGFEINQKVNAKIFLQVLAEGRITFLKFVQKDLETYNEYGNATILKRFKESYLYFIYKNGEYENVRLSKKDLEDRLSDKWADISSYLLTNKLSSKDEKSWVKSIQYYNSL